ncbi:MAG: hypothetical protein M9920_15495 [Verrucomicrobiae bacterium]|nr:hypothetical protein [Verrucomicrobiae bacterium]
MRKFLFLLLLLPVSAFAQGEPDPVADPDNYFFRGFWLGLSLGAIAFTFRLVRKITHHSPEL